MATIRKRGNAWEARIRKKGWPVSCRSFDTKSDAERWARQIESEMDRGGFVSRTEAENTTLVEALNRYLIEYVPRLAHPDKTERLIRGLKRRALAQRFLASIRIKDIADFIREREAESVSPNTIRIDLALLSRLFEVCSRDWGMESLSNPVKRVSKPKLPPGRTRRLQDGEEERLLAACSSSFQPIILFALETAMRREEIATLRWEFVNLKQRTVHLEKTKNGDERSVPLSPKAVDILSKLPRVISGTVFSIAVDDITKKMIRYTKKSKIDDFTFHDLRHEAVSRLFENTDLDMMEIKSISGHKSMQMLARYSHLRSHRLADRLAGKKR